MFQNSYQNGTYFDLFDPKTSQDKLKNVYKVSNVHGNNKVFDKQLKTYVLEFSSTTAKIAFPRQQKKDLYLIQQFLVFQIYFFPQMAWNIQLVISDLNKTKRRIILSNHTYKNQIKPFFVKITCGGIKQGIWNNLGVNLFSFIEAFKGQTYRSLDSIYITGHFKLRRVYTTNTRPLQDDTQPQHEITFLPKNFSFPVDVQSITKVITFGEQQIPQQVVQLTQNSTKNSSNFMKKSANRFSTPKTYNVKSEKNMVNIKNQNNERRFLANTNGPEMMGLKKVQKYPDQSQVSQTQKILKTPNSTEKNIRKKINKTTENNVKNKLRSSIQKKNEKSKEKLRTDKTKEKVKAKLNPWRTNPKQIHTDCSQLDLTKHEEERNVQSASTTMFKTKNQLVNKFNQSKNRGFDHRSDHYSDSQYVQLSQKFSTLTDGKFYKNQIVAGGQNIDIHNNDEIQQNIEMETNSICSVTNKKQQKHDPKYYNNHHEIVESICDSLEKKQPIKQFDLIGRASHYGFGQNLMKKYLSEVERPYSPPLGDRQLTQQELTNKEEGEKDQVELIYDPVLNCYYDHKTHTYYQLKN